VQRLSYTTVPKDTVADIHIYIYIYIYIYLHIWQAVFFSHLAGMIVALYLPMFELSALTPPIVDYFFETGLMKMFLWTVGSFHVFGAQLDLTLFLQVRSSLFENTHIFMLIVLGAFW